MGNINTSREFWDLVDVRGPDECWPWIGTERKLHKFGYGLLTFQGVGTSSHRVAFYLTHGRWPTPCCLHECDNPPCCNPACLFEGTKGDNTRDRHSKGRTVGASPGEAHPLAKLTDGEVAEIRDLYSTGMYSQRAIASLYKISQQHVGDIVTYQTRIKTVMRKQAEHRGLSQAKAGDRPNIKPKETSQHHA